MEPLVDALLRSPEPSLRWRTQVELLGHDPNGSDLVALRDEIRDCDRVRTLLAGRSPEGRITDPEHIYSKWLGAHWVLAALAELRYPPGDEALIPLRDQLLEAWLDPYFRGDVEVTSRAGAVRANAVPVMRGRHRAHASQHGNLLLSLSRLGLLDDRCAMIAQLLRRWQWPDGGWNCDRTPTAESSSVHETLLAMRGLAAYGAATGDSDSIAASLRAAEVFLSRRLFRRRSNGEVLRPDVIRLHFPRYWHYDVLGGLIAMAEVGLIEDERCVDALDLLESYRLSDGGWPAQSRYYRVSSTGTGRERVSWGSASREKYNPWVSVEVLTVLHAAGRGVVR